MKKLLIIGSGGHGRVVADCAEAMACFDEIAFLDESFGHNNQCHKWSVINHQQQWRHYVATHVFFVAYSDNHLRIEVLNEIASANGIVANIIHPSASVSQNAQLQTGIMVAANATINIATTIETGVIINTGATIDHDCVIGKGTHISPGCSIAGGVSIGAFSQLGIGSVVIEAINVANNTQTGAGAVIINNTESHFLYLGVPAKKHRSLH